MHSELTNVSTQILKQIKQLVSQLTDDDYSKPLELLSGNTIAKHIRHVLEIYDELLNGIAQNEINYDARKRNLLIEHNREFTAQFIDELTPKIVYITNDADLNLVVCFNTNTIAQVVKTTINRELAYNIEHATHHMAIMQIAVKHVFKYIQLDPSFGVAFSTQTYLKNVHA